MHVRDPLSRVHAHAQYDYDDDNNNNDDDECRAGSSATLFMHARTHARMHACSSEVGPAPFHCVAESFPQKTPLPFLYAATCTYLRVCSPARRLFCFALLCCAVPCGALRCVAVRCCAVLFDLPARPWSSVLGGVHPRLLSIFYLFFLVCLHRETLPPDRPSWF